MFEQQFDQVKEQRLVILAQREGVVEQLKTARTNLKLIDKELFRLEGVLQGFSGAEEILKQQSVSREQD